jgi:hypothetical protein
VERTVWVEASLADVHLVSLVNVVKVENNPRTHVNQIHVKTVEDVCLLVIRLCASVLKGFLDQDVKTKCQQIHVNPTHVKMEAFA